MGVYEKKEYSNGTNEILSIVSETDAFKVVGGGDASSALKKFNKNDKIDFVSTGGGATLMYMASRTLPGLIALNKEE